MEWFDEIHVEKVRLIGTDHNGQSVDTIVTLPTDDVTVDGVGELVAKMNKGHYRPAP